MVEFRWIPIYFLLLQIKEGAAAEPSFYSLTVRDGDDVTFPCNNVLEDHKNCDTTKWLFTDLRSRPAVVELVSLGKIGETAKAKSDRLSVSENCSLVIKNVRDEDVGRYDCRQFRSGREEGSDAVVYLSVVTMTEHEDNDEVKLNCSVSTYEGCRHTVKWLLQGQDVDKDNKDLKTSTSVCSSNVSFRTSHLVYTSKNYELLKCKVTHDRFTREEHLFTFSPPRSSVNTTGWWLYIVVAVGLAALLIIVVVVARWIITRANRTQGDTIGLTSNPEVNQSAPEDRQHTADPEDGVSYASISHTENSKAQVRGGDAVTYSTVKLPSADAYSLYANVNKPQI